MSAAASRFWDLRDNPAEDPCELAAIAAAEIVSHARGDRRRGMEKDRLLKLQALIAQAESGPAESARASARFVRDILNRYRRRQWAKDYNRGFCISACRTDPLCFEVMILSGGKVGFRKLQKIFSEVRKPG